ncbi:hypothetical protein B0H17DRAFT_1217005 [Mycena rosella]|uniref:Uncharacterized protein n=1 Tax=Mycena rosella TaxID=1033263 RepID=A0AAD7C2X3_MYCRO|nr:hypothetical protein B0H17DRAFT_1217005 [Mycena rosella]
MSRQRAATPAPIDTMPRHNTSENIRDAPGIVLKMAAKRYRTGASAANPSGPTLLFVPHFDAAVELARIAGE